MNINWLAAAVVLFFAILIINGWHKGFLKIIISFAGTIIVLIAVTILSPKVSKFIIENTGLYDQTRQKVISVFLDKLNDREEEAGNDSKIDDLNIPDIIKNDFIEKNASEMYRALLTTVFKDYISVYISKLIINAGSFVGVYIALSLIMYIVMRSSDIIARIPVIKGINKLCGALVGAGWALVIVWVFFFIIIMFLGNSIGKVLLEEVRKSSFLTYLFNSNYLFRFISK